MVSYTYNLNTREVEALDWQVFRPTRATYSDTIFKNKQKVKQGGGGTPIFKPRTLEQISCEFKDILTYRAETLSQEKKRLGNWKEMAQQVRALDTLAEYSSSIPRPYVVIQNYL